MNNIINCYWKNNNNTKFLLKCKCGEITKINNFKLTQLLDNKFEFENKFYCPKCNNEYKYIRIKPNAKSFVNQNKNGNDESLSYTPKCPTCGCPDLERIGAMEKVGAGLLFGLFSVAKQGKQYRCKSCHYEW